MNDRKKAVHVGTVVLETVKDHLWLSLTILAVVAGAVGAALVPPLVLGRIVDGLTAGEGLTLRLPLWYLVFTALAGGLESARESALTVFGQKTTHALRSRLMEKEGRLPADELNRQEPGALVSRFVGDVDTVETLFAAGIISMAADACRILSILIVVWQCSRGLAYLLLALLPVLFLFTRFVQKRMLHNQLKNRKAVSRASGYVPETVRNLRTIRTLGKETYMETRYDGALGESYRAIEGTNFYDALYSPVILTVNAVVVGAVMLLSASGDPAVLTLFGMTAGTAVTVMNYISQIFSPLESLGMEIQTIQSAVAGVRRINDFLAQPEQEPVAPETENPAAPMVELRDVDFGYEAGQNVLHHLNMEIREGELATLSGRTGAGKSTVFKLVLGLYAPRRGTVRIQGVDPRSLTGPQRRALYGYVEQRFHPVPGTVRDQITLYDDTITEGQVRRAAELAGLAEAIGALPQGYDTMIGENGSKLSGGERQRISIARALLKNSPIVLLDEATASLDVENESQVQEALSNLLAGKTVIVIAHRMRTVMNADKIVVLDEGRVVEQGSPAELLEQNGLFSRMVKLQSESSGWSLVGTKASGED